MRPSTAPHAYYCGIDRHARRLSVQVLDDTGATRRERAVPASPAADLDALKPYREGLVVGCECLFAGYWVADLPECERIPFVLGHALAMKLAPRRLLVTTQGYSQSHTDAAHRPSPTRTAPTPRVRS